MTFSRVLHMRRVDVLRGSAGSEEVPHAVPV